MTEKQKGLASQIPRKDGQTRPNTNTASTDSKRPTPKIKRVLQALASGQSLNRWDAARNLRDSCLNSTIAEIEGRLGLTISRHWETVPGYAGVPTRCCRYHLAPEQLLAAQRLLGVMQ